MRGIQVISLQSWTVFFLLPCCRTGLYDCVGRSYVSAKKDAQDFL